MRYLNKTLLVLCLMINSLYGYSQSDHIAYIRQIYNETKTYCDNSSEITQIEYRRIIPALGECRTIVEFYGDEFLTEDQSSHRWKYDGPTKLRFVNVEYNISVGTIKVEYLFDPKTQQILFYYENDSYNQNEYRFYFNNREFIKLIVTSVSDNSEIDKLEKTNNFTNKELEKAIKIVKKSDAYKQQFPILYQLEKVEKR